MDGSMLIIPNVLFAVVNYAVSVHTGNRSGAGTDANVFLNIFGEQGDTGDRPLKKSSSNKNKFERGNASLLQALNLAPTFDFFGFYSAVI